MWEKKKKNLHVCGLNIPKYKEINALMWWFQIFTFRSVWFWFVGQKYMYSLLNWNKFWAQLNILLRFASVSLADSHPSSSVMRCEREYQVRVRVENTAIFLNVPPPSLNGKSRGVKWYVPLQQLIPSILKIESVTQTATDIHWALSIQFCLL